MHSVDLKNNKNGNSPIEFSPNAPSCKYRNPGNADAGFFKTFPAGGGESCPIRLHLLHYRFSKIPSRKSRPLF